MHCEEIGIDITFSKFAMGLTLTISLAIAKSDGFLKVITPSFT